MKTWKDLFGSDIGNCEVAHNMIIRRDGDKCRVLWVFDNQVIAKDAFDNWKSEINLKVSDLVTWTKSPYGTVVKFLIVYLIGDVVGLVKIGESGNAIVVDGKTEVYIGDINNCFRIPQD